MVARFSLRLLLAMEYPAWAVGVAGSVVGLIILLGIFGNIMVITVITKTKQLKGKGHSLIVNLALADTLQSANLVFILVAILNGGVWTLDQVACQVHAYLNVEFVLASMLTLCAISVNRYFLIVRPSQYNTFFCPRIMRGVVLLIWLLPQFFAIPPILGWSRFEFQHGKSLCLFKFSFSMSYAFTLVSTITTTPLIIILFAYYKIFKIVGAHSTRVEHTLKRRSAPGGHSASVEEIRITRTLAVVIASYVICFVPATVINFVELFKSDWDIPVWLDLSSMILLMANHANNPIIYGALNRQYRKALENMAREAIGRKGLPGSSSNTTSHSSSAQQVGSRLSLTKTGLKPDLPDVSEIAVMTGVN